MYTRLESPLPLYQELPEETLLPAISDFMTSPAIVHPSLLSTQSLPRKIRFITS
jgi:hypothetical protein